MQFHAKKKVVVIGSGFAGLAAASVLAQRGHQVTVLEKNQTPGGRARAFRTQGWTFDMGPSWYWMPDVFQAYFQLFGKQVADFYDLKQLDPSFRIFFAENDVIDVPASPEALHELFESIEPGGGKQLQRFMAEAAYKYEVGMQSLVYKPGRTLWEFADKRFLSALFRMHVFRSFRSYVRRYFRDPRLIQLMEFPVLFLGGMPKNTPALYSLMNYAGLQLGTWYPLGGMYKIIAAMVQVAESLGVTVRTDTEVSRIAAPDNRATGVRTNGAWYPADAVVAAADYHHVEQRLLEPHLRNYRDGYWGSRVLAPSSLIFYVGVKRRLQNLQHHNLFFDEDFQKHTHEIYAEPKWPARPLFYVCCPSQSDASVAPEGMENLFILIPIAAGLEYDDALVDRYFELVMQRLERLTGQAIKSDVVFKRSYCVRDFQRDYHAFKGNAYGLANTLRQTAIFKPSIRSKRVPNLFFAGQLTVPGPGVPPSLISGQIAANETLKYLGATK